MTQSTMPESVKKRMQLEASHKFSSSSSQPGQGTAQHSTAQHSTAQHSTAQHSTAQHSTHLRQHQQAHQGPRPSAYDQPRQQRSGQQSRQDDLAQESQPVRLDLNVQKPVMVVQEPDASGKSSGCEEAVVSDGA